MSGNKNVSTGRFNVSPTGLPYNYNKYTEGSPNFGVDLSGTGYLDNLRTKGPTNSPVPSMSTQGLAGSSLNYNIAPSGPSGFGVDLSKQGSQNYSLPDVGGTGTGGDTGLFGLKNNTWDNIGTAGQLGMGALNTWTAMQQLDLQKDAFDFNKDMKQKEYGMARDAYDRNVARAQSIGDQMQKNRVG